MFLLYKKKITEHQTKLETYRKDPYAFDNKGILKNAPNQKVRDRIIGGRIEHLQREIRVFEENITKILKRN